MLQLIGILIGIAIIWYIGSFIFKGAVCFVAFFMALFQIMLHHIVLTILAIIAACYLFSTVGSIIIFMCYVPLVIAAEKRAAYSEIADKLKGSFEHYKIIPISDINRCKPYWKNREDLIKERCTPPTAPQEIAERWVSEGKLQKKELWDKKEYYYPDKEVIQNMYQETISMAISCVDPLLNDKGIYFDTLHIEQLDEYINSGAGGGSMPRLKRVILEKYLAGKNLYIGNIPGGNKVYINVQAVKEKLESAERFFFNISWIVNNADKYSKDILQGIMTSVHAALPDFSYVMLKEGGGTLWVQSAYESLFTCATCGEPSQTIQEYGPKRYCADCLKKIHAKEDANEANEKTVKRYIDAPPPGVVIKGGTESDNVTLLSGGEEE